MILLKEANNSNRHIERRMGKNNKRTGFRLVI